MRVKNVFLKTYHICNSVNKKSKRIDTPTKKSKRYVLVERGYANVYENESVEAIFNEDRIVVIALIGTTLLKAKCLFAFNSMQKMVLVAYFPCYLYFGTYFSKSKFFFKHSFLSNECYTFDLLYAVDPF